MEVRTACDLDACDGLVIPGGESTTMAHVTEKTGMLTHLREFVTQKRPVWGTCAGLIFLAESAEGETMWQRHVSIPGTCWQTLHELNSARAVGLLCICAPGGGPLTSGTRCNHQRQGN
jgi:putative intracellular protease/amidase